MNDEALELLRNAPPPGPEEETPDYALDPIEREEKHQKEILQGRKWKCRGCKGKPFMTCPCNWCIKAKGPCHHCGSYADAVMPKRGKEMGKSQSFHSAMSIRNFTEPPRISTGIPEVDKVLNGGLWPSTTLMLGAAKGTGKTSLLFRIAFEMARAGIRIFIGSGEMTEQQNFSYLKRIAGGDIADEVLSRIGMFSDTDGIDIFECIDRVMEWKAKVFFLDSLQHSQHRDSEASMGTAEQVNSVIEYVSSFCQKKDVASICVSHLTKSGDYSGSERGGHAVDGLLMIDRHDILDEHGMLVEGTYSTNEIGEDSSIVRKLYWREKSRLGPDNVVSLLQVDEAYRFGPLDDHIRMEMMKANARRRR